MTPMTPKISNVRRHDERRDQQRHQNRRERAAEAGGQPEEACARSRSLTGSQVVRTRVRLGNARPRRRRRARGWR